MSEKREILIDTAITLFYERGIRATGIDTVLAESQVAKKTLYNHFSSKEELVVAALERWHEKFARMIDNNLNAFAEKQKPKNEFRYALAFFDIIDNWINSDGFCGCVFINASAEYPNQEDPIHQVCMRHKQFVVNLFESFLMDTTIKNKTTTAQQLAILIDGSIVSSHTRNDKSAPKIAKQAAASLLKALVDS